MKLDVDTILTYLIEIESQLLDMRDVREYSLDVKKHYDTMLCELWCLKSCLDVPD